MFCGILIRCFLVFAHFYILWHSCIVGGVRNQAWDLEILCFGNVGDIHSCRWRVVWEYRIGVIYVMVHSCGDGFSIISIAISYDIRYARIQIGAFLSKSVVFRIRRGGVLVVM